MKRYLLYWIDYFMSRGDIFCKSNELIIQTNSISDMTYKYYLHQPMSLCEMKINMIIAKNPQLINSLDRNKNHPLIRKYSYKPIKN